MRVLRYVYDSASVSAVVEATLDAIAIREDPVDRLDVSAFDDRREGIRRATLAIKEGVGIGSMPEALFDDDGRPDFSVGVLIAEEATGRRSLHVGQEALSVLEDEQ